MLDPSESIAELLRRDERYRFDAYVFVFESLRYAQEILGLGTEQRSDAVGAEAAAEGTASPKDPKDLGAAESEEPERHQTGQELCEAIRLYALEQYGYMAKSVLNYWGVKCTDDFGEMVFNLINIGQMKKTPQDRREDFHDVFDFDVGLQHKFDITLPE